MDTFTYSGTWWLPAQEEQQIAGTVTFVDNDQITLTLNGLLEPDRDEGSIASFKAYPFILGRTAEGVAITLFDCREISLKGSLLDSERKNWKEICRGEIAYIGAHFTYSEALRFQAMDVYYSHLSQWAGVFPFRGHQQPFQEVMAHTSKGTIRIQAVLPLGQDFIDEQDITKAIRMRLEVQEALSLEDWSTLFLSPLQNLLTLATQRPNTLVRLQAYLPSTDEKRSGQEHTAIPVQIVFAEARIPVALPRKMFPQTSLFSLQEVVTILDQMLDSWLKASEDLESVCNLFFGIYYVALYLNQRFLFIAQAAESYQNRRAEQLDHSEEEHQRLTDAFLAVCPEEYKKWLISTLRYSNVTSFRKKLKKLVLSTVDILSPLIGESNNKQNVFVEKVFDTRNYLTHYDPALKSKSATGDMLFFITQTLSIALQTRLLYELNFTPQQCVEMFRKHEMYQYLLGQRPYGQ